MITRGGIIKTTGGGSGSSGGSGTTSSGTTAQPNTINVSSVTFKSGSTMTYEGNSVSLPPNTAITLNFNGVSRQFYVSNNPNFAVFNNVTATLNNGQYYLPSWTFQYSGCPTYTSSMTNRQLGNNVSQIESGIQIFLEPLPTCIPKGVVIPTTATANVFAASSVPSGTEFTVSAPAYDQTITAVSPSVATLVGLPLNTKINITYKYPNNTAQSTYLNAMTDAGVYGFTLPAPKNSVTTITSSTSAFINFAVKLNPIFDYNGQNYPIPNGDSFNVTINDAVQTITIGENNNITVFNGVQINNINGIWYSPPFSVSYGNCNPFNFNSESIGKTYPKTYSVSVSLGGSCLPAGISIGTIATANIFASTSVPAGTTFSVTLNGKTQTTTSPNNVSFSIPIKQTISIAYQYAGHSVHPYKLLPVSTTGVYGFTLPAPSVTPPSTDYLYYLIGGLVAIGAAIGGVAYFKGKVQSGAANKVISLLQRGKQE